MADQFVFSKSYQRSILKLVLTDDVLIRFGFIIKREYFSDPNCQIIYEFAKAHYKNYKENISKLVLRENIKLLRNDKKFDSEQIKLILRTAKEIYNLHLENRGAIIDATIDFCQYKALGYAVEEIADLVGDFANHETMREILDSALKVGEDKTKIGTRLTDNPLARIEKMDDLQSNNIIDTPWELINKQIAGGIRQKQIGLIMAPPKGFKTGALVSLGKRAARQGKIVVHFTLEMAEEQISLRYDQAFTFSNKEELKDQKVQDKIEKLYRNLRNKIKGDIYIKEYPSQTSDINDLMNYIENLRSNGVHPDLIILDYADLLKPSINFSNDTTRNIQRIYTDLIQFKMQTGIPIWTASQTNIEGKKTPGDIKSYMVAAAFYKLAAVDVVIGLNQSPEEDENGIMRLSIMEQRDGADKYSAKQVVCDIDKAKMKLTQAKNQDYKKSDKYSKKSDDDEDDSYLKKRKKKDFKEE